MSEVRLLYGATIPGAQYLSTDLLWKTKFQVFDPIFFCELSGRNFLLTGPLEYGRAKKEAKDCIVELLNDQDGGITGFLKKHGVSKLIVPSYFPAEFLEKFNFSGFTVKVLSSEFSWYPEQEVKTMQELEYIEEVQRKNEKVLWKVVRKLKESRVDNDGILLMGRRNKPLTAEYLRDFMELELMRLGCLANNTIIACGDQAIDPHCQGYGPLRANMPIVIDVFPRSKSNWYWADMSRTFFKGMPSLSAKNMYNAVLDAQLLAMDKIHAGVDSCDIHKTIESFFEKEHYNTGIKDGVIQGFFHGLGHGVGLDMHERPYLSGRYPPSLLNEFTVVTVEPGLYYAGIGGVRIEDMVVVEKDGVRNLTKFPKDLESMIIA